MVEVLRAPRSRGLVESKNFHTDILTDLIYICLNEIDFAFHLDLSFGIIGSGPKDKASRERFITAKDNYY